MKVKVGGYVITEECVIDEVLLVTISRVKGDIIVLPPLFANWLDLGH